MIDVPTLWAFLALADAALAAVVGVGLSAPRPRDGTLAWSASLGVRSLAFLLFVSRLEPRDGTLAVAAGLLALSMTLQAAAIAAFDRRSLPVWVHTAAIAAVAVPVALVASDPASAILFGGLVMGTLLAGDALLAWGARAARSFARVVLAACFAAASLAFVARGVAAAISAAPLAAFAAPNAAQSVTYLVCAMLAVAASFAFLLLQKERADAQALRLATYDPLTGAYNRRTFHEIAEREMSRARRAGQPLSIVMLDIDHFRAVNEKHGHRVGDQLLQRLGEVLRTALRKEDMLVRFGGEEFLVLLPDVPGPGAVVVAGRLRKAVASEDIVLGDLHLATTVSAGVAARLDEGPESVDTLVARAEEALALAKRRGRNRVVALSLGRSIAA
jgi:diguanylate cyclase (GGDEF)-like protein